MKIAAISDIHARGKDLDSLEAQLMHAFVACELEGIKHLLIPGDVFDRPGIGDQDASTGAICEVICGWASRFCNGLDREIHVIPGNHDLAGSGSKDALHVLDEIKNVHVYHKASTARIGGCGFAFLPWYWSGDPSACISEMLNELESLPVSKKILVAHIQVIGAIHGSTPCEAKPGLWQVSRDYLAALPFDRFFLGDFHRRQEVVPGRGGYVGALRQLNFGEEDNPAGLEIWDTESNLSSWHELNGAPRYRSEPVDDMLGDAHIVRGDNEILRVKYSTQPDPIRVRELEKQGVIVQQVIEREERIRRADVPEGILQDRHGLMRLWAAQQNPLIETSRIDQMLGAYDWLVGDKGASA